MVVTKFSFSARGIVITEISNFVTNPFKMFRKSNYRKYSTVLPALNLSIS